jgi:UDP-glucose 4-epimerase
MRVLVTGGAGYIGSVTVEQLVAAGRKVAVFDNLSQGTGLAAAASRYFTDH